MNVARGRLMNWNAAKGYGFIRPDDGGKDVFVHAKDIGVTSRPPRAGDIVHYQVMAGADGRVRAGDVRIEGLARRAQSSRRSPETARQRGPGFGPAVGVALLLLLGAGVLHRGGVDYLGRILDTGQPEPVPLSARAATSEFRCDGRQYCAQMSSCEEAVYFSRNCPDAKMDGDGDGMPCESQWCGR